MADIDVLFDELAAASVRGARPDLPAYLARAGDEADELARLVDAFLRTVPPPEPSEDDVAVMRARLGGEPGLLALRKRRGRKVDDVVDELASRLDVDDRPRLRRYYQRLEGGVLDPHKIDERVCQGGSAMAYYRRTVSPDGDGAGPAPAAAPAAVPSLVTRGDPAPAERDALDRLFLGDA